jgi:hypothetical protein
MHISFSYIAQTTHSKAATCSNEEKMLTFMPITTSRHEILIGSWPNDLEKHMSQSHNAINSREEKSGEDCNHTIITQKHAYKHYIHFIPHHNSPRIIHSINDFQNG